MEKFIRAKKIPIDRRNFNIVMPTESGQYNVRSTNFPSALIFQSHIIVPKRGPYLVNSNISNFIAKTQAQQNKS